MNRIRRTISTSNHHQLLATAAAMFLLLCSPPSVSSTSWQPYTPGSPAKSCLTVTTVFGLFSHGLGFPLFGRNSNDGHRINCYRDKQEAILGSQYAFLSSGPDEKGQDTIAETEKNPNDDDDDHNPFHNNPDIPQSRLIEVSSEVHLPFPATVAYDAYSNLPRQPTWSSWLDSVTVSKEKPGESVWTMSFWGISYSWTAVAVKNERPHLIQWKSITGLQNFGTVRFQSNDDGDSALMTMKMTFVAPRAVSVVFKKSTRLAKYVENKVITQSLYNFRDTVLEVDLKGQGQRELQEEKWN